MFDRLHHAGLVVADLDAAKKIFADALGLRVDDTRSPYPGAVSYTHLTLPTSDLV